jgi:hypothetical protein
LAAVIVTIICIAMIVMGCVILSQGVLTSADATALSVEDITLREGDLARTNLEAARAAELSWSDLLRVTVRNTGQTRLAGYDKWDFIVDYTDAGGVQHSRRLLYTGGAPAANQWQNARIGLNGPVEFFEPGILNPEEEMVILARPDPPPGSAAKAGITVAALNGASSSISFDIPGYTLLVPHAENVTITASRYYQLEEAAPAETPGTVMSAAFSENETGRRIFTNVNKPSREARHIFPLVGIEHIPAATWNVYYYCRTLDGGDFPGNDRDVSFDIDVLIRRADGGVRQTIATGAAGAFFPESSGGDWITIFGTYDFPGYDVADENDYLEVVYYGRIAGGGPSAGTGYLQVDIDDNTLPAAEQTRIEG